MNITNIKNNVNFLDLKKDGRISLFNQQIIDQGIIINDENYERLIALQKAGKLFYLDSSLPAEFGANIMPRDWDSVWDEKTQSWSGCKPIVIPLTVQAEILFNKYNYTGYKFNKLTKIQQTQLITYLDALNAIIDGTNIISNELPILPF